MNDVNFIITNRDWNNVVAFLLEAVPSFAASQEFAALDDECRDVSGLVCAAFTRFVVRLQQTALHAPPTGNTISPELEASYAAIEWMASSRDPAVSNLVVTEVFENIDASAEVWEAMKTNMGRHTAALYEWWRRIDA